VTQPAVDNIILARTVNAGSAVTYGLDFDAAYRPQSLEGLQLRGAANWDHARYLSLHNVPCWGGQTVVLGCNENRNPQTGLFQDQDLSGTPMVRAPDWQVNLGFDYELPIRNGYTMIFSNSNAYSSSYSTSPAIGYPGDGNYQSAFVKSDLGLTLRAPGGRWEAALIAKDVNDKITTGTCNIQNFANGAVLGGQITGGATSGAAGLSQVACFLDPGREVWLRLTFRPFASVL
jgi:iron complex outermembrane recepter protein